MEGSLVQKLTCLLALLFSPCLLSAQIVERTPLMGAIFQPEGPDGLELSASYRTETRIWNRGASAATVTITDTVGVGTPTLTAFTVPPGGVLELPFFGVFSDPNTSGPLFASVEFTSTEPIEVTTLLSGSRARPCASTIPAPPRPDFAGDCKPVGGPLLRGFTNYLPAGAPVGLGWLTADPSFYRTNLFVTNPGAQAIELAGEFRSFDGTVTALRVWTVPPRSLTPIQDIFHDPALQSIVAANRALTPQQGAATAVLTATGEFYVFAGVINAGSANIPDQGGDSTNRFTIVQP
jgi:hypothetical protein